MSKRMRFGRIFVILSNYYEGDYLRMLFLFKRIHSSECEIGMPLKVASIAPIAIRIEIYVPILFIDAEI